MLNQALAAGPDARALYLGARDRKQVTCTEQALVVRNERRQTLRYPLARVSRVVSSTVTDWSGAALTMCLRNGIGITWVDIQGNALGTCYPLQRHHPEHATAVELLTESSEGLARYHNWLRARRMAVLKHWGSTQADRISPALWETTKRDWVYGRHFTPHLPMALQGHCQAWVGAQLAAHGLQPQLWGPESQPINLDHDLSELLWADMNLRSGSLADTSRPDESATTLFERWSTGNGPALLLHLNSLYRIAMKSLNELPSL